MSKEPNQQRRQIPNNPGVRKLVEGLKKWSRSPDENILPDGFSGWHERGYLPHRDESGLTQFVTFHLADALPKSVRVKLQAELKVEDEHKKRKAIEAHLDQGNGVCHLKSPEVAGLVQQAFLHHQAMWYELKAWVIMPNHIHVLFRTKDVSMSVIIKEWKRFTAREANRLLKRSGAFWAADYWDTFIRDVEHEQRAVRYIENNPVKACLAREASDWSWSSARMRDVCGRLTT